MITSFIYGRPLPNSGRQLYFSERLGSENPRTWRNLAVVFGSKPMAVSVSDVQSLHVERLFHSFFVPPPRVVNRVFACGPEQCSGNYQWTAARTQRNFQPHAQAWNGMCSHGFLVGGVLHRRIHRAHCASFVKETVLGCRLPCEAVFGLAGAPVLPRGLETLCDRSGHAQASLRGRHETAASKACGSATPSLVPSQACKVAGCNVRNYKESDHRGGPAWASLSLKAGNRCS